MKSRRVRKDASAQERGARTAIHLALESVQAVDLSFDLPLLQGVSTAARTAERSFSRPTAKRATGPIPIPECFERRPPTVLRN